MNAPPTRDRWLDTPLGQRCLTVEQELVRAALEHSFGEQFLQIGLWGAHDTFSRYARTQRTMLLDWRPRTAAQVHSDTHALAITTASVDAVLLPHTLELAPSPHALLREVDRVLRADGRVVVLSFNPNGLWGLRQVMSSGGYPPGHRRPMLESRLGDWLKLLSFDIDKRTRYCHTLPLERVRRFGTLPREDWARRWVPVLGGGYMLSAQKRIHPMTPIRPRWRRRRLNVVGGLVKPTTNSPHHGLRSAPGQGGPRSLKGSYQVE